MACYCATTMTDKPQPLARDPEFLILSRKKLCSFTDLSCSNLSFDPIPESAAIRIVRNLGRFSLHYALFTWLALCVTLVQRHKVSTVYVVSMSQIMFLYFILLRMLPHLFLLYEEISKPCRVVLACVVICVLCSITVLELILAQDELFLFVSLAATMPFVGLHAILSKGSDAFLNEEVGMVLASCGASSTDQVENLV